MTREKAQTFAEGLNNLCESGALNYDYIDSLDMECREHLIENPHYIEPSQFGEVIDSCSALGFIDIIKEEYLQEYVDLISQKLQLGT